MNGIPYTVYYMYNILYYTIGIPRPLLGCRVLVYRSFSKIVPAILKDIVDWTVNSRIKSSQLLGILIFHLEDHVIHHLHRVLETLYKACGDDEHVVASEAAKCAKLIGWWEYLALVCSTLLHRDTCYIHLNVYTHC